MNTYIVYVYELLIYLLCTSVCVYVSAEIGILINLINTHLKCNYKFKINGLSYLLNSFNNTFLK